MIYLESKIRNSEYFISTLMITPPANKFRRDGLLRESGREGLYAGHNDSKERDGLCNPDSNNIQYGKDGP